MEFRKRFILLLSGLPFLAACSQAPTEPPLPTPIPLVISYSPTLRNLTGWFSFCTEDQPDVALFLEENSAIQVVDRADLTLWFGNPPYEPEFSAPLAKDEIVIIVNPANSLRELSSAEITGLFTGQLTNWKQIGGKSQKVNSWTYPSGNEIFEVFAEVFLQGKSVTSLSQVAPLPAAMLQAVNEDQGAIGYAPRSWVNESVTTVRITTEERISLQLPILALAGSEPTGVARNFLGCLQSTKGQRALPGGYLPWNSPPYRDS